MKINPRARWFPRVLGVVALLLAGATLLDLWFPPSPAVPMVCGFALSGPVAALAVVLHVLFLVWVGWGCFARKRVMVFVTVGYLVYIVESLWMWFSLYGYQQFKSLQTPIFLNVLVTAVLLAVGRVILNRRAAFDQ